MYSLQPSAICIHLTNGIKLACDENVNATENKFTGSITIKYFSRQKWSTSLMLRYSSTNVIYDSKSKVFCKLY